MVYEKEDSVHPPDLETVCDILDKLMLRQLHLMEDKMKYEVNIEKSIQNGSIQLAKSRYIMGHSSISATKLPIEGSPEFSASIVCQNGEEDGVTKLQAVPNEAGENRVNPMRWFGVLLPKNLHAAQEIFRSAIDYVVECANVQLLIKDNIEKIDMLRQYKRKLQTSQ